MSALKHALTHMAASLDWYAKDCDSSHARKSCRISRIPTRVSGTDPDCLVGCPVNAIFREGSKEIVIEDHCIGCGLCASNCPYGNITMYGNEDGFRVEGEIKIPIIRQKATTCDQCKSIGGTPRCVYSCPHDAAFRMSGEQLKETVLIRGKG